MRPNSTNAAWSARLRHRYAGGGEEVIDGIPTTTKGKLLEAEALEREAERLQDRAEKLRQLADENTTVRVVFRPGGSAYSYKVPETGKWPAIGDEVIVPVSRYWGGETVREALATVIGYGRGGYTGPLKAVTGRVIRRGYV